MNYMGPSVGLGIFSFLGLVIYIGLLALFVYLIIRDKGKTYKEVVREALRQ